MPCNPHGYWLAEQLVIASDPIYSDCNYRIAELKLPERPLKMCISHITEGTECAKS